LNVTCRHCGAVRDITGISADTVVYCACGKPFRTPPAAAAVPPASTAPAMPGPAPTVPTPSTPSGAAPKTHGGAVTALVLGIVSFFACGPFVSVPGLFIAYSARKAIDAAPDQYTGRDIAKAAVVVNWISVGLFAAIFTIGIFAAVFFGAFESYKAKLQ